MAVKDTVVNALREDRVVLAGPQRWISTPLRRKGAKKGKP
jgi:hypothetical protein